jgi:hypothetical protein
MLFGAPSLIAVQLSAEAMMVLKRYEQTFNG